MDRRVFLFTAWFVTGCASRDLPGAAERSGRLVLTRESPRQRTLLDMPATARYCERDSSLSIVAVSDDFSGALSMRSTWPVAATTRFIIASPLGDAGSGAAAARPLVDTSETDFLGKAGTITVEPGAFLAGTVEAEMSDSTGLTRLSGRFEGLVVRTGAGACP